MTDLSQWEAVIGLEIHVELNTKSKLFSAAPNHFGDEPNTNITEVCTGQPGSLPVLNKEAVRKAVLFGLAIQAEIAPLSFFDRKSYFYPDSPRNFQITQFEKPIIVGGLLTADVEGVAKTFAIDRAHLEDDAGMLKHFTSFAGVDYNRAGVPLIEIVSKPCIFSSKEAISYATAMRSLLLYLDVSDCNMEEGSLRIDANISVRKKGESKLRNKIEIKNLNSFNFMGMAIDAEIKRQVQEYEAGREIENATYRFDPEKKETILMRRKESADDYRYCLEPDLPPLMIKPAYIEEVRKSLPELPYARQKRYIEKLGIPTDSAQILIQQKILSDYFEEALKHCKNAKSLCNWILTEFTGRLKLKGKTLWSQGILAQHVGKLVTLIEQGIITGKIAKKVADLMVEEPGKDPEEIIENNADLKPQGNSDEIEAIVDRVLEENQTSIEDFRQGKQKAFAFLVGQVMKATQGTAPPTLVNELLKKKIQT